MTEFSKALDEAMRLAAECTFLSPLEAAMQHMGQCDIHEVLYIEIDPTNRKGCPLCEKEKSKEDNT